MVPWKTVETDISQATNRAFHIEKTRSLSGGCINQAYRIDGPNESYFVKANSVAFLESFQHESLALAALIASNTIKVPNPICLGSKDNVSYLVLEFIKSGCPKAEGWTQFGEQLAALHKTSNNHYGWPSNNTIGATPQPNHFTDNWCDFFRTHRLEHQLKLCHKNGFKPKEADTLLANLDHFFTDYTPQASLLHGDLWSGNIGFDQSGTPFIFDPCSYYGDRETDLAFTEFFGGFHTNFYQAYQNSYPLDTGYSQRKHLYNLYHCLNHFNLFGGSYAQQAQNIIDSLITD